MKKLIIATIIIGLLWLFAGLNPRTLDTSKTVRIINLKGFGTGVIDGEVIITASHVVKTSDTVLVEQDGILTLAHVEYNNPLTDIALIRPTQYTPHPRQIRNDVLLGQEVYTISYALGMDRVYNRGYVSSFCGCYTDHLILDMRLEGGASGCGVYNMSHELVAIVIAIKGHYTIAVPIQNVP